MQANRPRDTRLEVGFRKALFAAGLRYRKHVRPIRGLKCEPDVAFMRIRLAVFIDGCFWHSCPQHRATRPRANSDWWARKLDATKARDERNDEMLREAGWTVVRVWEHEDTASAVSRIASTVAQLRAKSLSGA